MLQFVTKLLIKTQDYVVSFEFYSGQIMFLILVKYNVGFDEGDIK